MQGDASPKVCVSCGAEVANVARVKDRRGRYLCRPCFERVQARRARSQAAPPEPEGGDVMSSLLARAKPPGARPCLQCGSPNPLDAVLCVRCGYNRSAGAVMTTQVVRGSAEPSDAGERPSMSFPGAWLLGALALSVLGGLVGSVIWYAVAQGLNVEISWVAIAVGILAGGGAAIGARGNEGVLTGLLACLIAICSIGVAKYQLASASFDDFTGRPADEALAVELLAEVIREEAGTHTRALPTGRRRFAAYQLSNISKREAAEEARRVWDEEMTDDDRQELLADLATMQTELLVDPFGEKIATIKDGLGLFDYLFAFLAIMAALGAGSGGELGWGDD